MKKTINILSVIDLASIAVWLISFITAHATQNETAAIVFLWVYIAVTVITAVFIITSLVTFILKNHKGVSKPLFISACVIDAAWIIVLIAVIKSMTFMGSTLF